MPEWPKTIVPPTRDLPFKCVFTRLRVLAAFLAALTGKPESLFAGLTVADPNLNPERDGDKLSIPGIRARVPGWDATVEMQRLPTPEAANRTLYRLGRLLTWPMKEGGSYLGMPRVVLIFIAAEFRMFPEDGEYCHHFEMKDDRTGLAYPNSPLIITLELLKLPATDDGTLVWLWGRFLASTRPEEFEALMGRGEIMAEAVTSLMEFSADEKLRIQAERREMALMDQAAREQYGEVKGVARVARQMLARKMPLADITSLTGLSETEVKRLEAEGGP
jgi:predicted transposase/invertase (TIGR01784 family)